MAGMELQLSNLIVILTLVFVVLGMVFAAFWYFQRTDAMTDEDRLHIERAKASFLAAIALGVITLVSIKKEKGFSLSLGGGSSRSASLL